MTKYKKNSYTVSRDINSSCVVICDRDSQILQSLSWLHLDLTYPVLICTSENRKIDMKLDDTTHFIKYLSEKLLTYMPYLRIMNG